MKWLLIFLCLPAFGQLPVLPFAPTPSSGFSPVAGYIFWYSVTNAVTNSVGTSPPANGDTVKAWGDLSANGYHLQQLGGTRCTYRSTTTDGVHSFDPAGGPYISWNSDQLSEALTNKFTTTYSQPNTFFFVVNLNGRIGAPILNGAADQNQQLLAASPPGTLNLYAGSTMTGPAANINPSNDRWIVWTAQYNQGSSILRSNGVSVTLSGSTVGTGTLKGITLGNYFNQGQSSCVAMSEVVGYNSALSASDMLKEEEYLANKHGITGVP